MSELVLVGVSHRTAGIELRERVALSSTHATAVLGDLVAQPAVREALALSTCGRTELYALASDADAAHSALLSALALHAGVQSDALAGHVHTARGSDAVAHLFRVAAGLESMVLGEVEILGQLRRARELAVDAGASSHTMARLVGRALAAGRLARERTGIAAGRASVSSVAVGFARDLRAGAGGRALVIGSGDTGAKTARTLAATGMDVTVVAGRGPLLEPLTEADVVVGCTAAPYPLVPVELLADVMERRRERPLVVFDLAMPRDFDPAARSLDGVQLYDLDDLTRAAQTAANARAAAVPGATALVTVEAERSARWLAGLAVVPTIKRLRRKTEGAVLEALRRSELATGTAEPALRAASEAIVARLLHHPTLRLREAAALGEGEGLAASVRLLFEIN